ncbi:MAG: carbohydrate kinase family protein [Patescibacteria group bacterium]|jgi:ribokinase
MYDIITIGSAVRDVFLLSKSFQLIKSDKFSTGVGECVALGEKIDVEQLVLSTGGGATNAAVTFANLGFLTAIVSRVGLDEPGDDVLRDLARYKVDTSLVKRIKGGQTAYSTLLTAPNGERTALVHRGVSSEFALADVPFKTLATKWYYVSSLSGNVALLAKIISHAQKTGAKIAVNPGGGELLKASELRALLKDVDVLLVNLEEAQKLTGLSTKDGKELAAKLSSETTLAVVTDGPRGAYASFSKVRYSARNRNVPSISRTGAGDAFGSGVVAALAKGMSVEDALKVGTLNAESVIQHIGAKAGIMAKWPNKKLLDEIRVFVSK